MTRKFIVLTVIVGLGSVFFAGCSSPTGLKDSPLPKGGPQASPRHPPGDVNSGNPHR